MVPLEGGVESWRQAVDFRFGDFPGGSDGKASVYNVGDLGLIPGLGSSLEKEMATHSSTLAYKIPWTEEPSVHGVAKSRTRLSYLHHIPIIILIYK